MTLIPCLRLRGNGLWVVVLLWYITYVLPFFFGESGDWFGLALWHGAATRLVRMAWRLRLQGVARLLGWVVRNNDERLES